MKVKMIEIECPQCGYTFDIEDDPNFEYEGDCPQCQASLGSANIISHFEKED